MRGAAGVVRGHPALVGVGLLGFLARGGLVAFLLPIVVLPTPIGIANFIGGTALTGSGPSDGLLRLIASIVAIIAVVLVAGAVLGAIADVLLAREGVRAAMTRGSEAGSEAAAPAAEAAAPPAVVAARVTAGLLGRLLVIRAICLLPVGVALAWAAARLVAAGYHQLILPDDLALPLAVRILLEALDGAVVLLTVWLLAEWVAGVAVRRVIVEHRSPAAALGLAVAGIARRPLTSLGTYGIGVVGAVLAGGPALVLAAMLWSRLQALLADDVPILLLLPATFVFVLVWVAGLAAVGVVVTWRSIAGTLDVVRLTASDRAPAPVAMPNVPPAVTEVALLEG
jgi:hypothetical protein